VLVYNAVSTWTVDASANRHKYRSHQLSRNGYRVPTANTIYDPEFIAVLKLAFEEACRMLPPGRDTQSTRALMAEYILKAAATGERDPVRLCAQALRSMDSAT
jgi:hypothetical protein